ncbi:MAG: sensor histidine kinase [Bacteriovoracaceae bacterium]|jgi:signal transduction histidine kinase|nr:sensor histidine kinase [Bacteriovoracaceae bacterium]
MNIWYGLLFFSVGIYVYLLISSFFFYAKLKEKLIKSYIYLAFFSSCYCIFTLLLSYRGYTPSKLFFIFPSLLSSASLSYVFYISSIRFTIDLEKDWLLRKLELFWKTWVLLIVLYFSIPLIFQDLSTIYQLRDQAVASTFSTGKWDVWYPSIITLFILALTGTFSFVSNTIVLVLLLKMKKKNYLLIIGVIISFFTIINDVFLSSGYMSYLVPLGFLGFVFESFRFNSSLYNLNAKNEKKVIERLKKKISKSRKEIMATMVSHDMRHAMRKVHAAASEKTQELKEALAYCDSVLDLYSEQESEVSEEKSNLVEILQNIEKVFFKEIECFDIIFSYSKEPIELPMSYSSALVLFSNLFDNSLKALSVAKTNKIEVRVHKSDKVIQIHFFDSGKGISEKEKQFLFDPYSSYFLEGQGLGLSIVREILLRCSGSISLLKTRPQISGTVFEILLYI